MKRGSDVYRKIESLLRQNGAVLKKSKKHRHWRFKSDSGFYNNLADLKNYLRTGHTARAPHRDVVFMRASVARLREL